MIIRVLQGGFEKSTQQPLCNQHVPHLRNGQLRLGQVICRSLMTQFKEEKEIKMPRIVFQYKWVQPPPFIYSNIIVSNTVTESPGFARECRGKEGLQTAVHDQSHPLSSQPCQGKVLLSQSPAGTQHQGAQKSFMRAGNSLPPSQACSCTRRTSELVPSRFILISQSPFLYIIEHTET